LLLIPAGADAQAPLIGFVKVAVGAPTVVRGGSPRRLALGDPIHEGDTLQTDNASRVGVTLRDETRLALGPGSQLTVSSFAFAPAEGRLGLVMRLASGILDYVSGKLSILAPASIRIETPASVVGVRGTHLLIGAATR